MTESGFCRVCLSAAAILWLSSQAAIAQQHEPAPIDAPTGPQPTPGVAADLTPTEVAPEAPDPQPTAPIPSDEQLQASGARIGRIDIKVVDVFDPENPKESGALYRAANFLHINTRESTVRPQLLFVPGGLYSRHVLDETARNLRNRGYLEDASVTPVAYHPDTNTVDLLVRVHDVWTLNPGASFSHSGGANHSGVQISEGNLLGLGKSVSVDRDQNIDRSTWKFAYGDPNLFSSRWMLDAAYGDTSDGDTQTLKIIRPFYSLDTRWSGGFQWNTDKRREERFQQAVAVDQYLADRKDADAQLAWSTGLRPGENNRPAWIQRITLGYHVNEQKFLPDRELGTKLVPSDIRLHYPYIGFSWFQDQYVVVRNRDQIARTEDLYVGRKFDIRIGFASKASGSDRNATVITANAQDAYRLGERQFLLIKLGINGRRESNQWRGTAFTGSLRYDVRQTAKAMFVASLNHVQIDHIDDSQQLFLGSDEGLRGYDLRYRSGTGRTVLVLEQRVYTDTQILRLLSVAGAAFVDAGKIHGETDPFSDGKSVFTDVGMGLRLGNIRSSGGDIFHLDIAYPINANGSDRKIQYSVMTKSTF